MNKKNILRAYKRNTRSFHISYKSLRI